jgi:hypothetical protein
MIELHAGLHMSTWKTGARIPVAVILLSTSEWLVRMRTVSSLRMLLPLSSSRLLRVLTVVCLVVGQGVCSVCPLLAEETPREQALKVNQAQQKLLEELRDDPAPRVFREGPLTLPPVAGIVVDEEDEPIAGAVVVLRHASGWLTSEFSSPFASEPDLAICMTESDGFFLFDDVPTMFEDRMLCVIALAPGRAVASWQVPKGDLAPRNTMILAKECSATCRIVDADGRPLQGAMVELVHVMSPELLTQIEQNQSWDKVKPNESASWDRCRIQPTIVTAADGTFDMPHLPFDAGVILRITHPDTPITPLRLLTGQQITSIGARTAGLEVADLPNTWSLPRGRQLTVRVTCDDPQVSFRGAVVECIDPAYPTRLPFYATGNGVFVAKHLASSKVRLVVNPPVEADYLAATTSLEFSEDQYTLERTVTLAPAKVVTGRVVDSQTGEGIPKVPLRCDILRQRKPLADPLAQINHERYPVETDQDGRFRYQVLHDANTISVLGEVKGYRSVPDYNDKVEYTSVDVSRPEGADVILKLDRAPRVRGIVRDHAGHPVVKAIIKSVVSLQESYTQLSRHTTNEEGFFEIDTVYASIRSPSDTEKSVLEFWNRDRTEAKVLLFPVWNEDVGLEDQVVDVRLSPLTTATGRIVHALTGEAVPGIIVKLCRRGVDITDDVVAEEATTDPEGRFVLSQVIPGTEHVVLIQHKGKRKRLTFVAQEGQEHDFGDTKIELQ